MGRVAALLIKCGRQKTSSSSQRFRKQSQMPEQSSTQLGLSIKPRACGLKKLASQLSQESPSLSTGGCHAHSSFTQVWGIRVLGLTRCGKCFPHQSSPPPCSMCFYFKGTFEFGTVNTARVLLVPPCCTCASTVTRTDDVTEPVTYWLHNWHS